MPGLLGASYRAVSTQICYPRFRESDQLTLRHHSLFACQKRWRKYRVKMEVTASPPSWYRIHRNFLALPPSQTRRKCESGSSMYMDGQILVNQTIMCDFSNGVSSYAKVIRFRIDPRDSILTSTMSPSLSHNGSSIPIATPFGVPVMITVPTSNVVP